MLPIPASEAQQPVPLGALYDCQAGVSHWEEWWASDKVAWCCTNEGVACSESASELNEKFQRALDLRATWARGRTHGLLAASFAGLAALGAVALFVRAGRLAAHPPLRALALQENQADAQLLDVEEPTPLE